jgi:hypothetical protein
MLLHLSLEEEYMKNLLEVTLKYKSQTEKSVASLCNAICGIGRLHLSSNFKDVSMQNNVIATCVNGNKGLVYQELIREW